MKGNDGHLPDDLLEVAERLREERDPVHPLELDELKVRAMSQARRRRTSLSGLKGMPMRSRVVTLALTCLLIGGTTAGGIAANGGNGKGNASQSQYRPGLGCGDKNHTHTGPPGNPSKTPQNSCPKGSAQNP